MGYVIAGGMALAWAVARQGAVQPADRFMAALAFGAIALVLFLTARRREMVPRLPGQVQWPAVLLAGSIKLSAVAGAKMGICGLGKSLVAQTPFEGAIALEQPNTLKVTPSRGTMAEGRSPCSQSPVFTAMGGKTAAVVVIAAAAGGATAAGIALSRGEEKPRSPSK